MSTSPAYGPSQQTYTACFSVLAPTDPSVMPRVLEVFAKRGMVPTTWYSSVGGPDGEELQIDVQMAGIDSGLADRIARSLRRLVSVSSVLTSEKRRALSA